MRQQATIRGRGIWGGKGRQDDVEVGKEEERNATDVRFDVAKRRVVSGGAWKRTL